MSWMTLGSLALPFQLNRNSVALRADLSRLSTEMTTGRAAAPAAHLRGDLAPLSAVETRARRVDAALTAARTAQTEAGAGQRALSELAGIASETAASLLNVASRATDPGALRNAGSVARLALDGAQGALSATIAGKALFSGAATDRPPLVAIETMLGTLAPLVAGATSADQVADTISAAFLDPGGLFETQFYRGAAATPGAPLDADQRAATLPTAGDPAIRTLLSGLAMAALAADDSLSLPQDQRAALAQRASLTLFNAGTGLTGVQARLGEAEGRLESLQTRLTGERSALDLARESLIGVDSFEAAGKLQEAQTRLEVLYAVTARSSRLSLVEYLR